MHRGFEMRFGAKRRRIDLAALTGGRTITVYPQHEVVKDLIAARLAAGGEIRFEAEVTDIDGIEGTKPVIHYREGGTDKIADLRFHRGLRRLSRRLPPGDAGQGAQNPRSHLSVCLARHSRASRAGQSTS